MLMHTKFGDVEYCSTGKGIQILFFHGGHSNCYETLSHKGFNLKEFQLITPSRPGYGKTPLNYNNNTPKKTASLFNELITQLSIEKVIVYGISAGGLSAIEFASNYPEKTNKLILASAISKKWLNKDDKTYKIAKKIFNPTTEKIVWGIVRFFSRIVPSLIAKNFYSEFSKKRICTLKKEEVEELINALKKYSSGAGFLNDIKQSINKESLIKIKCPTLIIHSNNDNSVSIEHAKNSHKLIKNSKIKILQNKWGHLFWIGIDSKKTIEKILNFIKE